jgi:hypothetical protein
MDEFLQDRFSESIRVNAWRDGASCIVETETQFDDLVESLDLDS